MAPYVNILYRVSRFSSGISPDAAMYLLAVSERPALFVGAVDFALGAVAGDVFMWLLVAILTLYVWPLIPAGVRRFLSAARDYFLPGSVIRARDSEAALSERQNTERIAELETRVRELERRLDHSQDRQPTEPTSPPRPTFGDDETKTG